MFQETTYINFNRQIAKNIWLMGFCSNDLASFAKPGQFIMVHLTGTQKDPLLARPFSIHSIQGNNNLMILYKRAVSYTHLTLPTN